jgi:hypothetical protein
MSAMKDVMTAVHPTEAANNFRKGGDPRANGSANGIGNRKIGPNKMTGSGAGAKNKLLTTTNKALFVVVATVRGLKIFETIQIPGQKNMKK